MEEEWAQMKKHMSVNYSQHDSPGSAVSMFTQKHHFFLIPFSFVWVLIKLAYCREQEIMMNIRSRKSEWIMRMSPLLEYVYAFA
jgi:hypothetical protein